VEVEVVLMLKYHHFRCLLVEEVVASLKAVVGVVAVAVG
jgi:hypothetical protein